MNGRLENYQLVAVNHFIGSSSIQQLWNAMAFLATDELHFRSGIGRTATSYHIAGQITNFDEVAGLKCALLVFYPGWQ